jgi:hypothetical protein
METGFSRYMFPSKVGLHRSLIYFPYWRFKGMLFSCVPGEIHNRFIDVSHQAVGSRFFPVSVGLRSQALKLNFVSPEAEGYFLNPVISLDEAMQTFEKRYNRDLPKPILHQAHLGETHSLIYAPFYADGKIYDAVLDEAVSPKLPHGFDPMTLAGGRPDWRIRFIATLCPACGWDLSGATESLVLACTNCHEVFMPRDNRLKKIGAAHLPVELAGLAGEQGELFWLPFWRIKAKPEGVALSSYADLVRLANLPKAVQPKWEQIPFRFWGPAFKVRPRPYLQIATNVTVQQPRKRLAPGMPPGKHHPVTMPLSEAIESMKLSLANFMRPRETMEETIGTIGIEAKGFMLVYLPFEVRHHEFVQPSLRLAVNKSQLALADNL